MMRSRAPILTLACAVAACNDPTATDPDTRPDPVPRAQLIGQGYVVAPLPLLPAGINDAGVIAGNVGGDAARLQNGALTLLPRVPNVTAAHVARAINNDGGIAGGVAGGRGLFWRLPNQAPVQFFAPGGGGGTVTVTAVNRAGVVVGSYRNGLDAPRAFRWAASGGGVVDITPRFLRWAVATDVNEAGFISGYGLDFDNIMRPIRWDTGATRIARVLGVGQATVIRGNGDAAGTNTNPAFIPPQSTQTRLWPFGGGSVGLPGPQVTSLDDFSEAGRLVGFTLAASPVNPRRPWTYLGGTTTWLAMPNAAVTQVVQGLRVNRCGSIVGTQVLTTGVRTGLLWTKSLSCDLGPGTTLP